MNPNSNKPEGSMRRESDDDIDFSFTKSDALPPPGATQSRPSQRILFADPSEVVQDIARLVLGQRGHQITIVSNSADILTQIQNLAYDFGLLDLQLLGVDGLATLAEFLENHQNQAVPYLIGLTNFPDYQTRLPTAERIFDRIILKPLRVDEIVPIIESTEAGAQPFTEQTLRRPSSAYRTDTSATMPLEDLGYNFLYFPRDFYGNARNNVSQRIAEGGPPDAVIITEAPSGDQIELMGRIRGTHSSPFIDLSGRLPNRCEISMKDALPDRASLHVLVSRFAEARAQMHSDFIRTNNDEELILVRMYCNQQSLKPQYDATIPSAVSYNTIINPAKILIVAQSLVQKGFITGTFFDRYNVCPDCDSARIQVREVCTQCADPELTAHNYIHHYRCAWQAPVKDFQVGDDLICPKCRYELKHFGKDYDKPGTTLICTLNGHHNSDPDVQFICLDCNQKFAAENAITRDLQSYEITQAGLELIESGRGILGKKARNIHLSDLPIGLIIEINKRANSTDQNQAEFLLVSVAYRNLRPLETQHSRSEIEGARNFMMDLLQEALPGRWSKFVGTTSDYALVSATQREMIEAPLSQAILKARDQISVPLEAVGTVYTASELSGAT